MSTAEIGRSGDLPRSYYEDQLWRRDDSSKTALRSAALQNSGAEDVLARASQAEIICVRIGTVDDRCSPQ